MADIARIEDRIDRVAAGALEVSDQLGGLRFQNMTEVMEFAKLLSVAGNAVPKHMQGQPGMCLAVCVQALEWRMSPFSVANKSYEVQGRLCFESQLVHALIEQRAPIIGRLRHTFEGEGDQRVCIVTAKLRETGEILEYKSPPFSKIQPKNSPLWKTKPDLQHYYNTSRDFCRVYFPDTLLGVYAVDELRDHIGPDNAKDVTGKPDVGSRLKGGKGRGFNQQHVERESRAGVIDESNTEAQRDGTALAAAPASKGDEPEASAQGALSSAPGAAQDRSESAAPPNSPQDEPPSHPNPEAEPAPATGEQASAGAGEPDSSEVAKHAAGDGRQTGGPGNSAQDGETGLPEGGKPAGLPRGFLTAYSNALGRARDVAGLKKRDTEVRATMGTPSEADTEEMRSVYAAYLRRLKGDLTIAELNAQLRELNAI